ncbi:Uncharacterized protein FKW44_013333 [Caligus rogercresseyi]|uniref:Uncharacterized protein n=1 Tax=Caligus rogercresseyi TaxID=217165 RepID=A0A7T8HL12_CALRO|nr:Uncharacterized protein FKW44_013333 [Caligus rogercresseyi]
MPPFFFRPDEKIDTEAYYKVLRTSGHRHPGSKSAGFFLVGAIESKTNRTPHLNLDSLKATIIKEWDNYPEKHIINACKRFRPSLEAVVKANGGHIE